MRGDEPLLNPNDIQKVIDKKINMDRVICGYSKISESEDQNDVNIPKIIFNDSEKLIYASRNAIPGHKSADNKPLEYLQTSLYLCILQRTIETIL